MFRLLPVVVVVFIVTLILTYLPVRRELAYRLGISGDTTKSCCTLESVLSQSGNFDYSANTAIYNNQVIDYPKTSLAENLRQNETETQVLGTSVNASGEEKWIHISLADQRLQAWEGNKLIMEFPISSGKWAPTPTGTFHIWYKTVSQKMEGGNPAIGTYYNLPNVPHNMFFSGGYAIHGAYWHNNFGHPMSHGCVNSPLDQVAKLFDWAGPVVPTGQNTVRASADNPGTRVLID